MDAADQLPLSGGRSRDRGRFGNPQRPVLKNYRPWRNRAIIYVLEPYAFCLKELT
ncbi:hypothetical protein DESC_780053 [Desulfosarcina cetonica]|nr:hypothetical protein DESC_780053 [Desulfosarcina cetonica]